MSDLLDELREHAKEFPGLIHGPLCGRAADEIERLTALLRDALPFVNDAGDDEDPEAKMVSTELAENIRRALEQARKG